MNSLRCLRFAGEKVHNVCEFDGEKCTMATNLLVK